ncbi:MULTISPECIES: 2-hydroxyacid dehydrogenase [unclassified Caulobacter]|uniref:2-hydroxyacid dehydrogenase n=1 Tax=unclassified Caulobacter TaxID=2648921 RepID=UPI0007810888|nr:MULTISPECIES: 2-hydroxyacid dehydrogenase [unclassified Caulobacter]AZS20880.1 2-hydroxyacid dehydrogenase [Caulobacter sp. FWC26]
MPQTATEKPHVLLSHEMLMPLQPLLESIYVVHRLWDYPDRMAFLEGPGQSIRAIVHAGEMALSRDMLAEMPRLGLIACVSVGYDGVDVPWCKAHGVAVTHSTGLNAADVADHAVGLVLAAWRGIVEGDQRLRAGRWSHAERMAPRHGLRGRKAGIVGLGHIGEAVARRLSAFDMKVAWWAPRLKEADYPRAESLMALARESDVLVVCARPDETNRHLINKAVIEAVGPQGLIVNVARGSLIDEGALIAALRSGSLGMAALDVFETEPTPASRWADVPRTVLTPHTAGATLDSIPAMVSLTLENLRRYFHGEPLATPVAA